MSSHFRLPYVIVLIVDVYRIQKQDKRSDVGLFYIVVEFVPGMGSGYC